MVAVEPHDPVVTPLHEPPDAMLKSPATTGLPCIGFTRRREKSPLTDWLNFVVLMTELLAEAGLLSVAVQPPPIQSKTFCVLLAPKITSVVTKLAWGVWTRFPVEVPLKLNNDAKLPAPPFVTASKTLFDELAMLKTG